MISKRNHPVLYVFFTLVIMLQGCSLSDAIEEHDQEPVGLVLYDDSTIVLRQTPFTAITDTLKVPVDSSLVLQAAFLDEEGTIFTPEPAEHDLETTPITGSTHISFDQETFIQSPFYIVITGVSPGTATFSLSLLHEGGKEFVSKALPVQVMGGN